MDSTKNKDLRKLSDIILGSLNINDSILKKPAVETIIFEIQLNDKQVKKVNVWQTTNSPLNQLGNSIASKIQCKWKPEFHFPSTVFYPLQVKIINRKDLLKEEENRLADFIKIINQMDINKYLFLPSPVLYYFTVPQ